MGENKDIYCPECGRLKGTCVCHLTDEQLERVLDSILNPDKYITEEDLKRWEENDYDNIPEEELYIKDEEDE